MSVTPAQTDSDSGGPRKPPVKTTFDQGPGESFPRELLAPAIEGPVIRPKSKPRIVQGDDV